MPHDLAALALLPRLRERVGKVQLFRKSAQCEQDVFPRAGVDLADLGGDLHLQGTQAVDVPVRNERRVRAAGRNAVRQPRRKDDFGRGAAAFRDAAHKHRVQILRNERNFQRAQRFGQDGGKFLRAQAHAARELFRLVQHAADPLVTAGKIAAFRKQPLFREGGCDLFLRLVAAEHFQQPAHPRRKLRARPLAADVFKGGKEARPLPFQQLFLLCFFLDRALAAAAEIGVTEQIIAVRIPVFAFTAEKFAADKGVGVRRLEPFRDHGKKGDNKAGEGVTGKAFLHVRIVRDLVFPEHLFQRDGTGGGVGQIQRDVAEAHAARRFAADARGGKAQFVLRVRPLEHKHFVRGDGRGIRGIEQRFAQGFRLGHQRGG